MRLNIFTKVKVGRVVLVGRWMVFPGRRWFSLMVMVIEVGRVVLVGRWMVFPGRRWFSLMVDRVRGRKSPEEGEKENMKHFHIQSSRSDRVPNKSHNGSIELLLLLLLPITVCIYFVIDVTFGCD